MAGILPLCRFAGLLAVDSPAVWTRLVIAAACGALLSVAYEPLAVPYVLPFAVAGFGYAVGSLTVPRAALVGGVFGLAFFLLHIEWMASAIDLGAWAGLSMAVALVYALVGASAPLLRVLPCWPLWMAVVWTAAEDLRSTWPFGGMPWGRLAYAAIDTPAAPAIAYVGTSLLSMLLAVTGFLLAQGIERRRLRDVGALVGVLALLTVPAIAPYPFHRDGAATVAAVQGNVPGSGDNMLSDPRAITRNENAGTRRLAREVASGALPRPDFVLWPENSSVVDVFYDAEVNYLITDAVRAIGVPVVVGAVVQDGTEHMLNQGIVWDPVTGPGDRYTKHHPVPYGEYVPFRGLWNPHFGRLRQVPRDMVGGTRSTPLRVDGTLLGDAICFDVAYDDVLRDQVRNGARLLAVQTSNATFIHTFQVDQQFAITRLRAIESGRWLVVASTNGISGVIAPDGTVVATAPRRTAAILDQTVGLGDSVTPAVRLGSWPSRGLSVVAVVVLAWGALTYRRRREETTRPPGARALRGVPGDAAGGALRDHQGRQLDRDPADDRPAGPRQPAGDVADPA